MARSKSHMGKVVKIDWEDAWTNGSVYDQDEIDKTEPLIMTLYGYCVRDDKSGMTVTMEHGNGTDGGSRNSKRYRMIWHVPKAMIRKIKVLS